MGKYTVDDLQHFANTAHGIWAEAGRTDRDRGYFEALLYGISLSIIESVTENHWIEDFWKNVYNDKYVGKWIKEHDELKIRHKVRKKSLAEILYNLQDVFGIESVYRRIESNDLETLFAELEAGRMITLCGYYLEYIVPSNNKGDDFDIAFEHDFFPIAADLKCKLNEINFSQDTIINSLKKVKDQLPKTWHNAVFMKVPELWVTDPLIDSERQNALKRFLSNTSSAFTVITYWDQWTIHPDKSYVIGYGYEERRSVVSAEQLQSENHLLNFSYPTQNWITIEQLTEKVRLF